MQPKHIYVSSKFCPFPFKFLTGNYLRSASADSNSFCFGNKLCASQQNDVCSHQRYKNADFLSILQKHFPRWGLYLVGSTMTGLATDFSDVDMCLVVRQTEMDQRNEAVIYLQQVLCNLWGMSIFFLYPGNPQCFISRSH